MSQASEIRKARDAERDRAADFLDAKAVIFEKSKNNWTARMLRNYAKAIRSNEHRRARNRTSA